MQPPPPPDAPFADKMAYYRSQHTSKGVRATHPVGTPIISAGMPLLFAKPKVGATLHWRMGHADHRPPAIRTNLPSTHKGWITSRSPG